MKRAIQLIAISAATAACAHAAIPSCGHCPASQATGGMFCMTRGAVTLAAAALGFAGTAFCSQIPSVCGMSSEATVDTPVADLETAEDDFSEGTSAPATA